MGYECKRPFSFEHWWAHVVICLTRSIARAGPQSSIIFKQDVTMAARMLTFSVFAAFASLGLLGCGTSCEDLRKTVETVEADVTACGEDVTCRCKTGREALDAGKKAMDKQCYKDDAEKATLAQAIAVGQALVDTCDRQKLDGEAETIMKMQV